MNARHLIAEFARCPAESVASDGDLASVVGLDSIVMVRLMLRLEEMLGRELEDAEMERLLTVGDVQRLLDAQAG